MSNHDWSADHAIVRHLAALGYSLAEAVLVLHTDHSITTTRSALSTVALRYNITFHGRQPPWTRRRHERHSAAMRAFHAPRGGRYVTD